MENFNELIGWALSNRHSLGLRFENMQYISEWLPGAFDIRALSARRDGCIGRSVAHKDEVAVGTALMELIERITIAGSKSVFLSGIAAHFVRERAVLGAALEALERDAVLSHLRLNEPFYPLGLELLDRVVSNAPFSDQSRKRRVAWRLHRAESLFLDCETIICTARTTMDEGKEKVIFGFGSAHGIDREYIAASKALRECIQNVPLLLGHTCDEAVSLATFRSMSSWQPIHHGLLGLDPEYAKRVSEFFPDHPISGSYQGRERREFRLEEFDIQFLELANELRELRGHISVSQVSHTDLMQYYVGLDPYGGENSLPHFIG